jgi:hypothetical protein
LISIEEHFGGGVGSGVVKMGFRPEVGLGMHL